MITIVWVDSVTMLLAFEMDISSKDVDNTELGVLYNLKVRPVLVLRQHVVC